MNTKSVPSAQAQAQHLASAVVTTPKTEADIDRAVTEAFSVVFRRQAAEQSAVSKPEGV